MSIPLLEQRLALCLRLPQRKRPVSSGINTACVCPISLSGTLSISRIIQVFHAGVTCPGTAFVFYIPSRHTVCMSTTTMARSSFSTAAFAQLVRRLRHTNARYNQIAHQFRCRIRPTHHAKRRAYRAGLRIDTSKARACPEKYVSVVPPPVLDRSAVTPNWVDPQAEVYATTEPGIGGGGDAYMLGMPLRNLPEVVGRKRRRREGRRRVMLRLPPLKLQLNVDYACGTPFQGPVPGAPRLKPRQLPEDESGVEEMVLGSASSSSSCTCHLVVSIGWRLIVLNSHGWAGFAVGPGMWDICGRLGGLLIWLYRSTSASTLAFVSRSHRAI